MFLYCKIIKKNFHFLCFVKEGNFWNFLHYVGEILLEEY